MLQHNSYFEQYVTSSSRPMVPPDVTGSELEMLAVSNALGGEVGELQNIVKKMLRDGQTADLKNKFLLEAGDVFHYLTRLVNSQNISLAEVQDANIDKLERCAGNRI